MNDRILQNEKVLTGPNRRDKKKKSIPIHIIIKVY